MGRGVFSRLGGTASTGFCKRGTAIRFCSFTNRSFFFFLFFFLNCWLSLSLSPRHIRRGVEIVPYASFLFLFFFLPFFLGGGLRILTVTNKYAYSALHMYHTGGTSSHQRELVVAM